MLYERFYEPCELMEYVSEQDGEGGWKSGWTGTSNFEAAVVLDTSTEARIAESAGMSRTYTVTCPIGTDLGFGSVFKRVSDGKAFRVTSDPKDLAAPEVATFKFEIVKAEAWEIPDE